MNPKWRVLWLMTGAQAGASVVQQSLGSLSPILVATFALSKAQLGIVFTALMVGSASCTAAAGVLTDRWGERRMILGSGALMALALVAAAVLPSYGALAAAMAIYGVAYAASTPAGGRAVLSWFDRDRGFAMGIRQTGVPVGGTLGAVMLPAVARAGGYREALAAASVLVIVPAVLAYVGYPQPRTAVPPSQSLSALVRGMRELARDPRVIGVSLTCMTLVCVQLALNAFLTVTAVAEVGVSATLAAAAFAVGQACAALGRLWWGFASDRFFHGERALPLATIALVAAAASLGVALLGRGDVPGLFVAAAALGISGAGWNGLMAAALVEIGGTEQAGSALGLALTATFGAAALAPFAFGALADRASLHLAWVATAALALLGVVPALWVRLHERGASRRG